MRLSILIRKIDRRFFRRNKWIMINPPYGKVMQKILTYSIDPIRYGAILLALNTIKKEKIKGNFAEVGIYRGETSKIIHDFFSNRKLYLFDNFKGLNDGRFKNTSMDIVRETMGNSDNIIIKEGNFPNTLKGLEKERFSFVMLDIDLYKPTLKGLEFFYPRMNKGGYLFIHDYHSDFSGQISKALKKFKGKFVEIPDIWGTVIIRK